MNIRNPEYNANDGVDAELDHPEFGWIPYTVPSERLAEAVALGPLPYVPPEIDLDAARSRMGITYGVNI